MTDREFENIIKEKFSAVKCSDVGKKRIFDALHWRRCFYAQVGNR